MNPKTKKFSFRLLTCFVLAAFSLSSIFPNLAFAQMVLNLPAPGIMVAPTAAYVPAILKGVKIYPDNPLRFDFIVDTGDSKIAGEELKEESRKLIKYFLASLTVPEEDLWVNLSPYEKERIIPEKFGTTEMGKDLLAQDYLLKQLTASLIYPEEGLGKEFWNRVYKKAFELYGTTNIPINTFNKVWIVPDKAVIYQNKDTAFVADSHLKVMLEQDYLALDSNLSNEEKGTDLLEEEEVKELSDVSSKIVKEIILPEIEKEINHGKNFSLLRQIHNSLILATWFKKTLKENILNKVYVNKNKVKGVDVADKDVKQKIYSQYLEAYKKGVYDYIKTDDDQYMNTAIERRYFSGGANFRREPLTFTPDAAMVKVFEPKQASVYLEPYEPKHGTTEISDNADGVSSQRIAGTPKSKSEVMSNFVDSDFGQHTGLGRHTYLDGYINRILRVKSRGGQKFKNLVEIGLDGQSSPTFFEWVESLNQLREDGTLPQDYEVIGMDISRRVMKTVYKRLQDFFFKDWNAVRNIRLRYGGFDDLTNLVKERGQELDVIRSLNVLMYYHNLSDQREFRSIIAQVLRNKGLFIEGNLLYAIIYENNSERELIPTEVIFKFNDLIPSLSDKMQQLWQELLSLQLPAIQKSQLGVIIDALNFAIDNLRKDLGKDFNFSSEKGQEAYQKFVSDLKSKLPEKLRNQIRVEGNGLIIISNINDPVIEANGGQASAATSAALDSAMRRRTDASLQFVEVSSPKSEEIISEYELNNLGKIMQFGLEPGPDAIPYLKIGDRRIGSEIGDRRLIGAIGGGGRNWIFVYKNIIIRILRLAGEDIEAIRNFKEAQEGMSLVAAKNMGPRVLRAGKITSPSKERRYFIAVDQIVYTQISENGKVLDPEGMAAAKEIFDKLIQERIYINDLKPETIVSGRRIGLPEEANQLLLLDGELAKEKNVPVGVEGGREMIRQYFNLLTEKEIRDYTTGGEVPKYGYMSEETWGAADPNRELLWHLIEKYKNPPLIDLSDMEKAAGQAQTATPVAVAPDEMTGERISEGTPGAYVFDVDGRNVFRYGDPQVSLSKKGNTIEIDVGDFGLFSTELFPGIKLRTPGVQSCIAVGVRAMKDGVYYHGLGHIYSDKMYQTDPLAYLEYLHNQLLHMGFHPEEITYVIDYQGTGKTEEEVFEKKSYRGSKVALHQRLAERSDEWDSDFELDKNGIVITLNPSRSPKSIPYSWLEIENRISASAPRIHDFQELFAVPDKAMMNKNQQDLIQRLSPEPVSLNERQNKVKAILLNKFNLVFRDVVMRTATEAQLIEVANEFSDAIGRDRVELQQVFKAFLNIKRDEMFFRNAMDQTEEINGYLIPENLRLTLLHSQTEETFSFGFVMGLLGKHRGSQMIGAEEFTIFNIDQWLDGGDGFFGFFVDVKNRRIWRNIPMLNRLQERTLSVYEDVINHVGEYFFADDELAESVVKKVVGDKESLLDFLDRLGLLEEVIHTKDFQFLNREYGLAFTSVHSGGFMKFAVRKDRDGQLEKILGDLESDIDMDKEIVELSAQMAKVYHYSDPHRALALTFYNVISQNDRLRDSLFLQLLMIEQGIQNSLNLKDREDVKDLRVLYNAIEKMSPEILKQTIKNIYEREFTMPLDLAMVRGEDGQAQTTSAAPDYAMVDEISRKNAGKSTIPPEPADPANIKTQEKKVTDAILSLRDMIYEQLSPQAAQLRISGDKLKKMVKSKNFNNLPIDKLPNVFIAAVEAKYPGPRFFRAELYSPPVLYLCELMELLLGLRGPHDLPIQERVIIIKRMLKEINREILPRMRRISKLARVYPRGEHWLAYMLMPYLQETDFKSAVEILSKVSVEGAALSLAAQGIHLRKNIKLEINSTYLDEATDLVNVEYGIPTLIKPVLKEIQRLMNNNKMGRAKRIARALMVGIVFVDDYQAGYEREKFVEQYKGWFRKWLKSSSEGDGLKEKQAKKIFRKIFKQFKDLRTVQGNPSVKYKKFFGLLVAEEAAEEELEFFGDIVQASEKAKLYLEANSVSPKQLEVMEEILVFIMNEVGFMDGAMIDRAQEKSGPNAAADGRDEAMVRVIPEGDREKFTAPSGITDLANIKTKEKVLNNQIIALHNTVLRELNPQKASWNISKDVLFRALVRLGRRFTTKVYTLPDLYLSTLMDLLLGLRGPTVSSEVNRKIIIKNTLKEIDQKILPKMGGLSSFAKVYPKSDHWLADMLMYVLEEDDFKSAVQIFSEVSEVLKEGAALSLAVQGIHLRKVIKIAVDSNKDGTDNVDFEYAIPLLMKPVLKESQRLLRNREIPQAKRFATALLVGVVFIDEYHAKNKRKIFIEQYKVWFREWLKAFNAAKELKEEDAEEIFRNIFTEYKELRTVKGNPNMKFEELLGTDVVEEAAKRGLEFFNDIVQASAKALSYLQENAVSKEQEDAMEKILDFIKSEVGFKDDAMINEGQEKHSPNAAADGRGGIDLNPNNVNLEIQGEEIDVPMPAFDPAQLELMDIEGFYPVIYNIIPVTNLPLLLGTAKESEGQPAGSAQDKTKAPEVSFQKSPAIKEVEYALATADSR